MTDEFFTINFDEPSGDIVRPNLHIAHPAIEDIYARYGLATSKSGFFRIVDPEEWQEHYMPWFRLMRDEGDGEIFEGPELYPFMITAFGSAYIFANLEDEDLVGHVDITNDFNVMGSARSLFKRNLGDPIFYEYNLYGGLYEDLSPVDPPLAPDECFGFFPPLSMGGEASMENVRRVKLREHLDFLAQAAGLPTE
jgi:hypothetical protein